MCGIIGYVSTSDEILAVEKEKFLEDALILDTFRGMDSTGLLTLCEDFTLATHKTLDEGWDFVRTQEFWDMPNGWAAIGHNRAATKGEVTLQNAHPFNDGPVTMVHNGTLHNMGRNLPNFCDKQDVDSMNICRALAHVPPEEATEVLKHLQGAYALAWVDARDASVNIVRNRQRPLHFAHNSDKSILWFMSDGNHLKMVSKRRWVSPMDMGQIFQLGTHAQLKFKKGNLTPEVFKYDPFVERTVYRPPAHSYSPPSHSSSASGGTGKKSTPPITSGATKAPYSHRIYLNGKTDLIPDAMLSELDMVTDLAPEDTLEFTPERWIAYPDRPDSEDDQRYGMALGTAWIPEWESEFECAVHHVSEAHADKVTLKRWRVTPYCVTDASFGDYGCTIMAKIKAFDVPIEGPLDHDIPFGSEPEEEGTLLRGPFGRLYSTSEWASLTRHGCSNCSADLMPEDAEEIWWVGEMESTPLCYTCCDYLTGCEDRMKECIH